MEKFLQESNNNNLNNEDVVNRILADGTDEELEALRLFHDLKKEQVELYRHFAKLRKEAHLDSNKVVKKRKSDNPIATEEELSMGAYVESIEPQVLQTVLNLRKKGYPTYESGFHRSNKQVISFEKECLDGFNLPNDFIRELKDRGATINIKPDSIDLIINKPLDLSEIKKIWEKIEELIPDLKKQAPPCKLRASDIFRRKQSEL